MNAFETLEWVILFNPHRMKDPFISYTFFHFILTEYIAEFFSFFFNTPFSDFSETDLQFR